MEDRKNTYMVTLHTEPVSVRISTRFDQIRYEWDTPRHCNAEYELHIVLQGSCRLEVENDSYLLTAGSAVIIAPGQYHYPTVQPGPFERFSLSFSMPGNNIQSLLHEKITEALVFQASDTVINLCYRIFEEYTADAPYHSELMQFILAELIILSFRSIHPKEMKHNPPAITKRLRNELIDEFFSHNFASNCQEELLAKDLNVSKRQLSRVLHQYYGMGFRKKLITTRMDRAAWLLRTTDHNIIDIAEQVGYSSEAAFYQVFRIHFGTTPRQYRLRTNAQKNATFSEGNI